MRVVEVDRRLLTRGELVVPGAGAVTSGWVAAVLDRHRVPDGFPFVVDDDGTMRGCRRLNGYLLDAWGQNAFDLGSMRRFHVYHLARLLRFVRRHRAGQAAADAGVAAAEWLAGHGEPWLDLTDATRADLNAYRQARLSVVQQQSWKTEAGCLSGFTGMPPGWGGWTPIRCHGGRGATHSPVAVWRTA